MKREFEEKGLIFVPVKIKNKHGTYRSFSFVFDTGSALTQMSPSACDDLGFSAKDGKRRTVVRSPGGNIEGFTIEAQIQTFDKEFSTAEVGVLDIAAVKNENEDLDGLLGMDVIGQLKLIIDGPAHKVQPLKKHG